MRYKNVLAYVRYTRSIGQERICLTSQELSENSDVASSV